MGALFGRCSDSWDQTEEMLLPPWLDQGSAFVPEAGGLGLSPCSLVSLCLPSSSLAHSGWQGVRNAPACK